MRVSIFLCFELFGEEIDLAVHRIDLLFQGLLVCQELRIVGLELDVLIQDFSILGRQEVDGILELLQHIHPAGLPGREKRNDRPERPSGDDPHKDFFQKLEFHLTCLCLLVVTFEYHVYPASGLGEVIRRGKSVAFTSPFPKSKFGG